MAQANAVLDVIGREVVEIKSVNVPFIRDPIRQNPAELGKNTGDASTGSNESSPLDGLKTVGYVVKLRLKYS